MTTISAAPVPAGPARLVADAGGTNARFGLQEHPGAAIGEVVTLPCADHATLSDAIGVYLGGGIVPRLGEAFDQSPFRARFDAKGRFSNYLAAIPVHVIVAQQSQALRGAGRALDAH